MAGRSHTTNKSASDQNGVHYFQEEELPPAFYEHDYPEEFKHYQAKLAALRSAAETAREEKDEVDQSVCESICYECSHELPVATFSAAEGTSAICLHAWEYEVDAHLLYSGATSVEGEVPSRVEKRHKTEEKDEATHVTGDVGAMHTDRREAEGVVVFRALPLPTWV
ncbi:hypothetical protein STCU_10669 [Strigomonas culicis]|uniref:Uncharacterized protein n=1 Tax=Strigomonas culicis TaxID=28005 RepID=S9URW8_9TRYP|nr:hypothetical protein STCU_10669 [Strigomonas culicis]|eukprot:EPY17351.1 hypothetical protein STCU_10669 [Strigomonas culicis]